MRKWVIAPIAGLSAFVLTYPAVCSGGEGDPGSRCETIAGWHLPGFTYSEGREVVIYLFPSITAIAAFLIARWLLGRGSRLERSGTATDQ